MAAEDVVQLDQVVVTATKTAQSIRDVPATVSVVSREQIDQSSATTVDQLLQSVPGLYAARMDPSSPNRIAQTYVRGLPGNSRTLVLLDGVPMNVLYDGQVDWSQLSTRDVERVEVVRGASSGLYGANAMGGVINILSRAPAPGAHTQVDADYGSLNSKRLGVSHSQSHGATAFSVSASHYESDGYNMWRPDTTVPVANRDRIGTVKDNFTAKLIQDLGAVGMLEAGLSYLKDESTNFYKPGAAGYVPQTREQYVPSLRYVRGGEDSQTTVVAYGRMGKQWADTLATPAYSSISEKGYYEDKTFGLNAQHTEQLGKMNKLTVGGEFVDGSIDNHFTYPATPTRFRDTTGDVTRYGAFAQDELTLTERWRMNLAMRYDYWKTGGNQTDTGVGQPNSTYTTRSDSAYSPKISTLFKLTSDMNVRASAGKAFNLPDMFNLYANTLRGATTYWANPDLKPEKVKSYDLGLDYYFGKKGHVKATAYYNDATDFIYSVTRNATNVDKVNVGGVKTKGLELEGLYRPFTTLALTAAYTLNESKVVKHDLDPTLVGKTLINVPRNQAYLRADWDTPLGAKVFATVNYVGSRYGNDANTTTYNAYTTYDVGGSYPLSKSVTLRVTANNVTNKKYDGIGYIAPGTIIMAGVSAKF